MSLAWRPPADDVLAVTGTGPDPTGWFFVIDRDDGAEWRVEVIDEICSFGLVVHDERVYRVLCSAPGFGSSAELLVYDRAGVVSYRRLDGLIDPHGIAWTGEVFAIPSPPENGIAFVDGLGEITGWRRLPGSGDAWHVNGITMEEGSLFASAFGRFRTERSWAQGERAGHGLIFNVANGEPIVEGLHCPHDPLVLDGAWTWCDSGSQRLIARATAAGALNREILLGAWTRGFAFDDDLLYVGLSGHRYEAATSGGASIAVLDRRSWEPVARIALPCQEIQSISRVPRSLLGALRRGFRTNAMRTSVQDRSDIFRQFGNIHPVAPLTPMPVIERDEARIRFDVVAPLAFVAGRRFSLDVAIRNDGPRTLFSGMPFPVLIGHRWLHRDTGSEVDPLDDRRHALPEPIVPGATLHLTLTLVAPSMPGVYQLQMTLVQEWIRWFDADDPEMGVDLSVNVEPAPATTTQAAAYRDVDFETGKSVETR